MCLPLSRLCLRLKLPARHPLHNRKRDLSSILTGCFLGRAFLFGLSFFHGDHRPSVRSKMVCTGAHPRVKRTKTTKASPKPKITVETRVKRWPHFGHELAFLATPLRQLGHESRLCDSIGKFVAQNDRGRDLAHPNRAPRRAHRGCNKAAPKQALTPIAAPCRNSRFLFGRYRAD